MKKCRLYFPTCFQRRASCVSQASSRSVRFFGMSIRNDARFHVDIFPTRGTDIPIPCFDLSGAMGHERGQFALLQSNRVGCGENSVSVRAEGPEVDSPRIHGSASRYFITEGVPFTAESKIALRRRRVRQYCVSNWHGGHNVYLLVGASCNVAGDGPRKSCSPIVNWYRKDGVWCKRRGCFFDCCAKHTTCTFRHRYQYHAATVGFIDWVAVFPKQTIYPGSYFCDNCGSDGLAQFGDRDSYPIITQQVAMDTKQLAQSTSTSSPTSPLPATKRQRTASSTPAQSRQGTTSEPLPTTPRPTPSTPKSTPRMTI